MKIAYLVNVYPAPSHSFIRREILAHEAAGHQVVRFSIRRFAGTLADAQDQAELRRTQFILAAGIMRLVMATLGAACRSPLAFYRALRATLSLGKSGSRGTIAHLAYLAEACLLLQRIGRAGIEHLHVHFGTNSAAVALLCRLLGGPAYSFTVHGPDEFDSATSLGLSAKVGHAAFTVAISQFGKSQLCRWVEPRDYAKFRMVRCGLDETFLRDQLEPIGEAPRLLFVGRLTATKGIYVLIEALILLRQRGFSYDMSIIGDGPERTEIAHLIDHAGLADHVHLMGWQSQEAVRREMLRSRALVLPSFAEGLPVVLMESLALGRPVITTWIAGIPELVENGEDGWLVPPGAVEELSRAMEQALVAAPAQLQRMGHHGRVKVLRDHNAATEAAKLAALFSRQVELA